VSDEVVVKLIVIEEPPAATVADEIVGVVGVATGVTVAQAAELGDCPPEP